MNSSELLLHFRRDIVDLARPYLWSDEEAFVYMADAYVMFVRLTGGVADFTSAVTEVSVTTGETSSPISKKIMRIMSASRRSDGNSIELINATDVGRLVSSDYGKRTVRRFSTTPGSINAMVIGQQRGLVRWLNAPQEDDIVDLHVYRLPLDTITGDDQEFTDVDEHHHIHLVKWMKAHAYRKQDADTFDPRAADECDAQFRIYCERVKAETEREKHKTRVTQYGGL